MSIKDAKAALAKGGTLHHFMSTSQRKVLEIALRGEEAEGIAEVVMTAAKRVNEMPKTYETDGQGKEAMVWLHYFKGGMDFHITEKDAGDDGEDIRQHQTFGLANLGHGGELGYISIEELIFNGVELDLYWTPVKLKDIGQVAFQTRQ